MNGYQLPGKMNQILPILQPLPHTFIFGFIGMLQNGFNIFVLIQQLLGSFRAYPIHAGNIIRGVPYQCQHINNSIGTYSPFLFHLGFIINGCGFKAVAGRIHKSSLRNQLHHILITGDHKGN